MMPDTEHDTIAVTLQLDPESYEFFARKARKAGLGLESYLTGLLAAAGERREGGAHPARPAHKAASVPHA